MKNMKVIIALLLSATGTAALPIPKAATSAIARAAAKYSPLGRRLTESMTLIKSNVECDSNDDFLGTFSKLEDCADKVLEAGGRFFIYGKEEISGRSDGDKTGQCYHEKTSDATCSEGWESDSYDFYDLAATTKATLIKSDVECDSNDDFLGMFDTLHECADKVLEAGGRFFIYGKEEISGRSDGDKTGQCYHEKTSDATCSEGWESDSYDFYQVACMSSSYVENKKCTACPSGFTCDGSAAAPHVCDSIKYVLNNVCTACPSGHTCDGAAATKCAVVMYVMDNVCMACPDGFTCDGTTATCAATEYVLDNECEACPSGFTCDGAVATVCDSIKYVLDNKCEDCPDGFTCDGAKATKCSAGIVKENVCKDCPSGSTCDGTEATACAAPKYAKDNACVWPKLATAAERAECLAGSDGSCPKCCTGITGVCKELTQSGADVKEIPLTDEDDCVLLKGDRNKIDATSPRLKRPWLFSASARRVGKRRRRRGRRRGRLQQALRQRLPRPSGIPVRRRLVRARAARRSRRRFARA